MAVKRKKEKKLGLSWLSFMQGSDKLIYIRIILIIELRIVLGGWVGGRLITWLLQESRREMRSHRRWGCGGVVASRSIFYLEFIRFADGLERRCLRGDEP